MRNTSNTWSKHTPKKHQRDTIKSIIKRHHQQASSFLHRGSLAKSCDSIDSFDDGVRWCFKQHNQKQHQNNNQKIIKQHHRRNTSSIIIKKHRQKHTKHMTTTHVKITKETQSKASSKHITKQLSSFLHCWSLEQSCGSTDGFDDVFNDAFLMMLFWWASLNT